MTFINNLFCITSGQYIYLLLNIPLVVSCDQPAKLFSYSIVLVISIPLFQISSNLLRFSFIEEFNIKDKISNLFYRDSKTYSYIQLFIFNLKNNSNYYLSSYFNAIGVGHLVAISSYHFNLLEQMSKKIPKWLSNFLIALLLSITFNFAGIKYIFNKITRLMGLKDSSLSALIFLILVSFLNISILLKLGSIMSLVGSVVISENGNNNRFQTILSVDNKLHIFNVSISRQVNIFNAIFSFIFSYLYFFVIIVLIISLPFSLIDQISDQMFAYFELLVDFLKSIPTRINTSTRQTQYILITSLIMILSYKVKDKWRIHFEILSRMSTSFAIILL